MDSIAGVYAVGGASRFPSVYRRLRERFGPSRVHRSPHSFAASAIGLAVFLDGDRSFNRFTADLRGYKSFIGRSIIAAQAYYRGADGRLPDWERPFLGGARTVRGYDAGEFIGDNIALVAAELRVPITPPVPIGLVGLDFFFDSGTVYDHGTALGKTRFRNGVGGGIYFFVAFVGLQVDVAYGLQMDTGTWR